MLFVFFDVNRQELNVLVSKPVVFLESFTERAKENRHRVLDANAYSRHAFYKRAVTGDPKAMLDVLGSRGKRLGSLDLSIIGSQAPGHSLDQRQVIAFKFAETVFLP